MIETTPPDPIVGDLLTEEIAAQNVPVTEVILRGDVLEVHGATEDHRAAVEDVVAAHDPSGYETDWQVADRQFREAVSNAGSVADLRDALLGGTDNPGAEPRRSNA